MSTFTGLVLGLVTAAVVALCYGEEISSRLRTLLTLPPAEIAKTLAATELPLQAQLADDALGEIEAAEPAGAGTDISVLEPPVSAEQVMSADTTLQTPIEERWREFAASSALHRASGDFPHHSCFLRASLAHDVPQSLLLAVASGESNFDLTARSPVDAIGLMQIQWPQTSRHLGVMREAQLYDPCTNVDAGARYIAELRSRYEGDLHRTLAAYNYGPTRISDAALPEGAVWYSQYIYQHLQKVLGKPHVASSELVQQRPGVAGGFQILMSFNESYRARAFLQFVARLLPEDLELAQLSESLGRHDVVLLYGSEAERQRGLELIRGTELLALTTGI